MKTKRLNTLTNLGFSNSGNYCDPVTGECYSEAPVEEKETSRIDPVCKMEVDAENSQYSTDYEGEKYYFCSATCQQEFEKNPGQYLMGNPSESTNHTH